MADQSNWQQQNILFILAKLQELTVRMAALELRERVERVQALLQAQPK